jgi:hypothetical protein
VLMARYKCCVTYLRFSRSGCHRLALEDGVRGESCWQWRRRLWSPSCGGAAQDRVSRRWGLAGGARGLGFRPLYGCDTQPDVARMPRQEPGGGVGVFAMDTSIGVQPRIGFASQRLGRVEVCRAHGLGLI